MSAPDIPSNYLVRMTTEPDMDINTNINGTVNTNLNGTMSTDGTVRMTIDDVNTTMTLKGDPGHPVAMTTDVAMDIKNMPHLTRQDLFDLIAALKKPNMRLRMPVQMNFGVSVFPLNLLGLEALSFSICGEPQLILDEYRPNAYERCEVECEPCDPCE
ncbi:MAG TPA: hypothetical protein ENJ19_06130 [Gammaproteobacteria bacterium]|nr:hypothetical protein [Gammaproteobacteria bacterium]